jgi:1-acyl-sn-glycerol-3-phosphate acyltransferase
MAIVFPAHGDVEASALESTFRVGSRAAGLVAIVAELLLEARLSAGSTIAFADRAQRTAQRLLDRHGVKVDAIGHRPMGRAVIVTNHVSYLDPLVVSSIVPCLSIAKGETRRWPLIGAALEGLGVLFVRRGDPYSGATTLRKAMRALEDGAAILNFPEGTTSDGRSLGPFLRGAFGLALLAGVPLVPARIAYDDAGVPWFGGAAFVPHYGSLARVPRVTARVRFGAPMTLAPGDDPARVASRAHAIIAAMPAF